MYTRKTLAAVLSSFGLAWAAPALADSICDPDGLQESGSIWRICMPAPEDYNGRLVIFAHGFQDAGTPVQIPEEQLSFPDFSIPELINELGFGFATNSYSKTGLAIVQGAADIVDLVDIYTEEKGEPEAVYLTGASEGGIITALLSEQRPDVFDGGLAACGPVGDFRYQINYFGDSRATFEYFWPGIIPGDPFQPSQDLIDMWGDFYDENVKPLILADEATLRQWARVARLPYDQDDFLNTVEQSARDVLRYSVVNLNDAVETLGGFPYGNDQRIYRGSANDMALNRDVPRAQAEFSAIREMSENYDTTGELDIPLVTLHTTLDQQVPYPHEVRYQFKTLLSGDLLENHINTPVQRYGHCNFTGDEVLLGFLSMLELAGDFRHIEGVAELLDANALRRFEAAALLKDVPYELGGTPRIVFPAQGERETR